MDSESISIIGTKKDLQIAFAIRHEVFVKEQGIKENWEIDAHESDCKHFLIHYMKKPVGTCRIRFIGDSAKLQRLAVLEKYRGKGLGKLGFKHMVKYCKRKGIKNIFMNAQYYLKDYYSKLGFITKGKPFFEAKLKHIKMVFEGE